ncbi:Aromatic-ring hydroxylase-like protein [Metarhizium album ARSEF 1941]|uniref:Aromatic-ring hydroxylase-like protein n=1 Tax=Metarhizium album (strain ARSEF 1941) TaxID=1081103 RepID=A0A0B2WPC5_METAS|nr:Aromatic-ring hydroxylase-like protein [Metarhizium album ARSEF 1941]KHN94840.1 Aromatic-ring hydroxylase-like protein [Metarhizium album ARSEF 1941]
MLHVIIVGAGIAGLSAAISLRRAGHCVHLYEKSSMNNEIGAAITVPPNATRFLTAWGLDPIKWRWVMSRRVHLIDPCTLEPKFDFYSERSAVSAGGVPLWFSHRVDLHNALKWMATRSDGPGVPATIHLNSPVMAFDPSKPSIRLVTGREICGDLVIAADGVHSLASEAILGRKVEPVDPVHANCCYRFLIPVENLEADPETRFFTEGRDGLMRIFDDAGTPRRLVVYPCRNNTFLNFVGLFREQDAQIDKRENWHATVDLDYVLDTFSGYDNRLLKVISKATDVRRWPLLYRPPLPAWSKGRLTLAGDAAHPMLPLQGQGAAQGLEDGLALGIILCGAKMPSDIERRLEIYYATRHRRTSVIQILSNVSSDQTSLVSDELRHYMREDEIPRDYQSIITHNFGFDVVRTTLAAMRDYDPSFRLPEDFFEGSVIGVPGTLKDCVTD